jgi:transcriptional regulator with XRE-family HTH domain
MSLGEKLKNLRLRDKRTLKAQSELCGVKLNTVFRWEHDLAVPRESEIKMLAELHGVPAAWLALDSDVDDRGEFSSIDQRLFNMFDKLSTNQKYQILGYIERVYVEGPNHANSANSVNSVNSVNR